VYLNCPYIQFLSEVKLLNVPKRNEDSSPYEGPREITFIFHGQC